jgi:hypothetical protein
VKVVEPRPFADPDAAARELVEIAGVEAVQDGRVYLERVNARRGAGQRPVHKNPPMCGIRRREVQSQCHHVPNSDFETPEGPDQDSASAPALKGKARDRGPVLATAARAFAPDVRIRHRSSVQPRLPLATTWSFKPA